MSCYNAEQLLLLLQMSWIRVLPSHSCRGTLQKSRFKLLHSSMQTSADHRSRWRHVSRMVSLQNVKSEEQALVSGVLEHCSTYNAFVTQQYNLTICSCKCDLTESLPLDLPVSHLQVLPRNEIRSNPSACVEYETTSTFIKIN